MKVLLVNGSPNEHGCTYTALSEIAATFRKEDIEADFFWIGKKAVQGCIACGKCAELKRCVFANDGVNDFAAKAKEADGFVFGTPVYYAHPSGRILSFLDRVFYSSGEIFACKPGAAVAIARRGGTTASFDVMNKYFGISQMPVAGSTYWNIAHGMRPGEIAQDAEGLQTMRNLARQLAWMLKCFEAGKAAGIPLPEAEHSAFTNFIR